MAKSIFLFNVLNKSVSEVEMSDVRLISLIFLRPY